MTATTFTREPLRRVRHDWPCGVCGRSTWCVGTADGRCFGCMRVDSDRPMKGGGWWHRLDTTGRTSPRPTSPTPIDPPKLSPAELVLIDRQCRADLTPDRLARLSARLRVSAASLRRLGVGWCARREAFTFPMRDDASGRIVGIRTRHADGAKRSLGGSRLGLIGPADLLLPGAAVDPIDVLLLAEGESDVAAALDLGFAAIGRPGCLTCVDATLAVVARLAPARVAIVADADEAGQRGGHALARRIAGAGIACRVLTLPGAKDLRAFKALPDGTHHDLLALIDAPANRTS